MIVRIFAPSVLAKPLNNAQMCEAFLFLWVYGNKNSVLKYFKTVEVDGKWTTLKKGNVVVDVSVDGNAYGFTICTNRRWLKAGVN